MPNTPDDWSFMRPGALHHSKDNLHFRAVNCRGQHRIFLYEPNQADYEAAMEQAVRWSGAADSWIETGTLFADGAEP